jgi:hypothetical protein
VQGRKSPGQGDNSELFDLSLTFNCPIMKIRKIFCFLVVLSIPAVLCAGNRNDTTEKVPALKPIHKNTIKFNPTPMLIWGEMRNITLSYERVVNPKQSFSVQAGYLVFPKVIGDTIAHLIALSNRQKFGINLAADYRFYPLTRNRRPVPDGLYIGPYLSYYGNRFSNDFDILNTTVDQKGHYQCNIDIVNLGFELGYQFIFWKRFSLDLLLFGPSLTYYSAQFKVSGDLDKEEIDNISQEVVDKILNRFPALGTLFSEGELSKSGFNYKFGSGFRYSIQIGFHF